MTEPEWKDHHTAVMLWAARDDTAAMTAERTGISLHMVRAYRHQALEILDRHSIQGAVAEAIAQGILSVTDPDHPGYYRRNCTQN